MNYQQLLNELEIINPKDIKNNIFQDLEINAYCFNVHDTDTISVLFKYNNEIIKYNIRLIGVDSPELHSDIKSEVELCIKGTEYLKNLILKKIIKIKTKKTDKYGRLLGELFTIDNNTNINQNLISMGFCREYEGKTKSAWNLSDSDDHIININDDIDNVDNVDNTVNAVNTDNINDTSISVVIDIKNNSNINDNIINNQSKRIKRKYVRKLK